MKVTLKKNKNLNFVATARQFTNIQVDEPQSFYGTDLGPSSIEYLLIGIGGCLGTTFTYCLQKNKIEIDDLEIIIDGSLKHSGPEMRLELNQMEVEIYYSLKSTSPSKKLDWCIENFHQHCVVLRPLTNGIPIKTHVQKKKR